jgi:hypothetical protein
MPVTLNNLWDAVYKDAHAEYSAMGKCDYANICVNHHRKVETDKKYEFEKDNEPVYSGVDTFRSSMGRQIANRGPMAELASAQANLINLNRGLRNRQYPGGEHTTWINANYLLQPTDGAAYTEDIEREEFNACKGNVSELPGGGYSENWGLIAIPAWITGGTGPQPSLSDAEVADIQSELEALLESADKAPGNVFRLTKMIREVNKKRSQVINWHDEYLGTGRVASLTDIWRQKMNLHDAMRMQLQVQRLKEDNEKLARSAKKGTRVRPEEVIETTVVDLIKAGDSSTSGSSTVADA